jgi:hypothetical protein
MMHKWREAFPRLLLNAYNAYYIYTYRVHQHERVVSLSAAVINASGSLMKVAPAAHIFASAADELRAAPTHTHQLSLAQFSARREFNGIKLTICVYFSA